MHSGPKGNTYVGSPIERREDWRFLRGAGEYVDDIARDGLLHAAIVRSPVAHGRIRGIDARAALALAGVHAVITAADLGPSRPGHHAPRPSTRCRRSTPFLQPVIAQRRSALCRRAGRASCWPPAPRWPRTRPPRSRSISRRCRRWSSRTPPRAAPRWSWHRGRHQRDGAPHRCAGRCRARLRARPTTAAASASRCSATPRSCWSRAACSPNGTRRAAASPSRARRRRRS